MRLSFLPRQLQRFTWLFTHLALAAVVYVFAACNTSQRVVLQPDEDDLVVLNGCVISAVNYLATVQAKHDLEKNFWAKVMLVRYNDLSAGHAYCVWETNGVIYGYDREGGGFPIPVYTKDPKAIATVLADGLSRVLKKPLTVRSAEFVEPATVTLARF